MTQLMKETRQKDRVNLIKFQGKSFNYGYFLGQELFNFNKYRQYINKLIELIIFYSRSFINTHVLCFTQFTHSLDQIKLLPFTYNYQRSFQSPTNNPTNQTPSSPKQITYPHTSYSMSSNILPHEFHNLSQQNSRLNQNLISVTLNHEYLLEQNRQLSQELKKKDYALIESTLREKNLDHTLKNVQSQYTKLQDQYQEVYNMIKAAKRLQVRDIYKKESQLAFDMANIQRESYRQAKQTKNQQINQYQERLINLARENDQLKVKMLEMTSEYNTKLYDLKSANIQNETKLNALKSIDTRHKQEVIMTTVSDFELLQLQLKLQNTKERLQFYIKENTQIKTRNIELNAQLDRLLTELKQAEQHQQTKEESSKQDELWKVLNKENSSVDYISKVLQENTKLRKQIQDTTQKYILLTETYPKLIDQFQNIKELQDNLQKLNQVKLLETKLSQTQQKCLSLQQSLSKIQAKHLAELKSRQTLQYKTSILTKRFNEIFIKMNPYFDIYQYESLELDQAMFQFFDQNKDYKTLKDYEGKIAGLKRELKQTQANYDTKERQLKHKVQEHERQIKKITEDKQQIQTTTNELSDANKALRQQLSNYQLTSNNKIQQQSNQVNMNEQLSLKRLQHEVSIPLLQQMISNLHLEREQLFKAIYNKDKTIAELSQELHSTKLNQTIKTVNISQSQGQKVELPSVSVQFSQLLKKNHELDKKYDQTVDKLQNQLKTLRQQLNNQHNWYQLQVKKYQNDYESKLVEMKRILDKWMHSSEQLRIKLQLNQHQQKHREANRMEGQNQKGQDQRQGQMIPQQPLPINAQQQPQPHINNIPLVRHPSLQKLPVINQQSSNKLIGQSTVQTLTQTLKKYQQDMNEVLAMCVKVSKDYSDLKERVKAYEEVERKHLELGHEMANLKDQLKQTNQALNEKNLAIATLETLYNAKSSYCDELQSTVQSSNSSLTTQLAQQQQLTQTLTKQLQDLKEKFYQLAAKPSSSAEDLSLMNKGEFETIVIMQANKNKEISNLAEKNKHLESKLHGMMQELNQIKVKSAEKKAQEVSPMERAEMKQLASLLQGTNVIELVKKANQIIDAQAEKEKQVAQEQQQQAQKKAVMEEEREEGEHVQA